MDELAWFIEWVAWRLPRELFERQAIHFREMWKSLKGNARALGLCNIFWTLPANFMGVYLQLYMVEQGLTKIEVGTIASAQLMAQLCGALIGGYMAERFGRLRTITLIDTFCWPLAYLIFSLADGYLGFMVGAILVGVVFTLSPSWTALFLEGSPSNKRMQMFAVLQVIWFSGSMLSSLSGFLVGMWGIEKTCRVVFGCACVLTAFSVRFRGKFLHDPTPPRKPFRPSLADVEHVTRGHWSAFRTVLASRRMTLVFVVQVLTAIFLAISATYNYLYFADRRGNGLPAAALASFPLIGGASVLLTTFLVVPFITLRTINKFFIASVALMAVSISAYLIAPVGSLVGVIVGVAAGGVGYGIFNPALQGYWSNLMGDRERPRILAFTTVASMLITIPTPTIAGALYTIHPRGPLLMQIACYFITGACFFAATRASPRRML